MSAVLRDRRGVHFEVLPPLALYIHIPWCVRKCPYCDFNSHERSGALPESEYVAALFRDLEALLPSVWGRRVHSIFIGGGTPSLFSAPSIDALLAGVRARILVEPGAEITLEANPGTAEAERFRGYRDAGVNRVSLGVQALDPADLKFLGREHSTDEAIAALETARRHFRRYSFDLIYARPGQTAEAWLAELERALALAGEHLSLYQLTIERGTRFYAEHQRGSFVLPGEEQAARMFEETQARLEAAGLPAYEISNHARRGAACRHNLIYWRYQDYVGVGPGAHGRFAEAEAKRATRRQSGPENWLAQVEAQGHGTVETSVVTGQDRVEEALMMGLRLSDGVDRALFAAVAGADPVEALGEGRLAPLVEAGFLEVQPDRLKATAAGRQRLNSVLERLIA